MTSSLSEMLAGIVDDNGLIYTAQSASERLSSFQKAGKTEEGKYLQNLGIPVERLNEIPSEGAGPTLLTAVGVDRDDWETARIEDAESLNSFQAKGKDQPEINRFSVRAPTHLPIEEAFESLRGFASVDVQVVLRDPSNLSGDIAMAVDREWISLGLDALSADAETISRFIVECCGLEVPFQLIGLSGSLFTDGNGFGVANVAVAAFSAFVHELSIGETRKILEAKDLLSQMKDGLSSQEIEHARDFFWGVGINDLALFLRDAKTR